MPDLSDAGTVVFEPCMCTDVKSTYKAIPCPIGHFIPCHTSRPAPIEAKHFFAALFMCLFCISAPAQVFFVAMASAVQGSMVLEPLSFASLPADCYICRGSVALPDNIASFICNCTGHPRHRRYLWLAFIIGSNAYI